MTYSVQEYLRFTYEKNINPLDITAILFCAYLESLARKKLSPATITNKCSHIRQWITDMGGNVEGIYNKQVKQWQDAMEKTTGYKSRVKPPVPVEVVKQVVLGLPRDNEGYIIRSAILLIAYGGFARAN